MRSVSIAPAFLIIAAVDAAVDVDSAYPAGSGSPEYADSGRSAVAVTDTIQLQRAIHKHKQDSVSIHNNMVRQMPRHPEVETQESRCLCVFDIDRTLTGAQGKVDQCPRNREITGVHDNAYGHGWLTLSALSVAGIDSTFCNQCHLGICSAGDADGENSKERAYLLEHVLLTDVQKEFNAKHADATKWSYWGNVNTPLSLNVPNKEKQNAVEDIRKWYSRRGVSIASNQVYFFGDRVENIPPFAKLGFNAREISCDARDKHLYGGSGMVGVCGATPEEVIRKQGIYNCDDDRSGEGCHTALEGDECYANVKWAMEIGIKRHPHWYPGLTASSSFVDFQLELSKDDKLRCPEPCHSPTAQDESAAAVGESEASSSESFALACRNTTPGEECYANVNWVMTEGIYKHPSWYPGLTASSSFHEIQEMLFEKGPKHGNCPKPCLGTL